MVSTNPTGGGVTLYIPHEPDKRDLNFRPDIGGSCSNIPLPTALVDRRPRPQRMARD